MVFPYISPMINSPTHSPPTNQPPTRLKIGLALGSGAARGWAHIGVLQALEELDLKPDIITGCSAGALVGGAHLLGVLPELEQWARTLGPLGALREFSLNFGKGGLINPDSVFDSFRKADRKIEDLPLPFAANAADLATGQEVVFTNGSVLDAVRASSAIPMIFHAAKAPPAAGQTGPRWLVDGALCNPVPVNLARDLGADLVIAVDLNSISRTLQRFSPSTSRELTVRPTPPTGLMPGQPLNEQLSNLIAGTKAWVDDQVSLARSRHLAAPRLVETAIATIDIFQANLGDVRALIDTPEVRLTPDLRACSRTAFDQHDQMIAIGYETAMAAKADILALKTQQETP